MNAFIEKIILIPILLKFEKLNFRCAPPTYMFSKKYVSKKVYVFEKFIYVFEKIYVSEKYTLLKNIYVFCF